MNAAFLCFSSHFSLSLIISLKQPFFSSPPLHQELSPFNPYLRNTLLGVPLGKQIGPQIRPHIVGPDLKAKLFAAKSIFLKKMTQYFFKNYLFRQQT